MPRRRVRRSRKKPNVNSVIKQAGRIRLKDAAYGAWKGIQFLKGIINAELKRWDLTNQINPDDSGIVVPISNIPAGDDFFNRNGNSILAKYISMKFKAVINSSATHTLLRVLVFIDTQNQGTTPTINDLFTTTSGALTTQATLNPDNTQRFTVLADIYMPLSISGNQMLFRKGYRRLNFHLRYTGTAATDWNKNAIFFCAISDVITNLPELTYTTRIAFYDN